LTDVRVRLQPTIWPAAKNLAGRTAFPRSRLGLRFGQDRRAARIRRAWTRGPTYPERRTV